MVHLQWLTLMGGALMGIVENSISFKSSHSLNKCYELFRTRLGSWVILQSHMNFLKKFTKHLKIAALNPSLERRCTHPRSKSINVKLFLTGLSPEVQSRNMETSKNDLSFAKFVQKTLMKVTVLFLSELWFLWIYTFEKKHFFAQNGETSYSSTATRTTRIDTL